MAGQHPCPEGEHILRHNLHARAPHGIRLRLKLLKLHPYLDSSSSSTCFLYFILVSPESPFLINCLPSTSVSGCGPNLRQLVFSGILGLAPRMGLNHHWQGSLFSSLWQQRFKTIAPKQSVPRWWCLFCKAICKGVKEWRMIGAQPMNLFRDPAALFHYVDVFRLSFCVHRGLGNWLFAYQNARRLWVKFCPLRWKGWPETLLSFGAPLIPVLFKAQWQPAGSHCLSAPAWSEQSQLRHRGLTGLEINSFIFRKCTYEASFGFCAS